jgi:hypothetical protein
MLGKKDYQLFADALSQISNKEEQEKIITFLHPIFKSDNPNFSYDKFSNWIYRRENNLSMKGTRYNPKYMPLGVK